MAAILCVKPCELCGSALAACGKGCNAVCATCGSACNRLGNCCSENCSFVCRFLDLPFSSFLLFGYAINVTGIIFMTIKGELNGNNNPCDKPNYAVLNIVALVLFIINILFGIHLHINLVKWYSLHATNTASQAGISKEDLGPHEKELVSREVVSETIKFLKYDVLFAIYLLVSMAEIGLGFHMSLLSPNCKEPSGVKAGSTRNSVASLAGSLILLYFFIGGTLIIGRLLLSFCIDCMDDANLFKLLCCMLYYPFFYDSKKAARVRREREARYRNEQLQRRAQQQQHQQQQSYVAAPSAQRMGEPVGQTAAAEPVIQEALPAWEQPEPAPRQNSVVWNPPPSSNPEVAVSQQGSQSSATTSPVEEVGTAVAKGAFKLGKSLLGAGVAAAKAGAAHLKEEEKKRQQQQAASK